MPGQAGSGPLWQSSPQTGRRGQVCWVSSDQVGPAEGDIHATGSCGREAAASCGRQAGGPSLPSTFEQQTGAATEAVRVAAGRRRTVTDARVRLGVLCRLRRQRTQRPVLVRAGRRRRRQVMVVVVRHDRRRLVARQ